jgi:hypothetical protein
LHTIVLERFSEWSQQITLLLTRGNDFAELCSDYEELAVWLANHCHDGRTPESECATNCLLRAEMEVEILQFLEAVTGRPRR